MRARSHSRDSWRDSSGFHEKMQSLRRSQPRPYVTRYNSRYYDRPARHRWDKANRLFLLGCTNGQHYRTPLAKWTACTCITYTKRALHSLESVAWNFDPEIFSCNDSWKRSRASFTFHLVSQKICIFYILYNTRV